MQISREAERTYARLSIDWEEGFISGATQKMIIRYLDGGLRNIDAYHAFVDPEAPERSRRLNGLGEFFVYNKGDKLDWNHPNRAGHRRIAEYLARVNVLGNGKGDVAARQLPPRGAD